MIDITIYNNFGMVRATLYRHIGGESKESRTKTNNFRQDNKTNLIACKTKNHRQVGVSQSQ